MDADRGAGVSFHEFEKGVALAGMRPVPAPPALRALFDLFDVDRDGRVSWDEMRLTMDMDGRREDSSARAARRGARTERQTRAAVKHELRLAAARSRKLKSAAKAKQLPKLPKVTRRSGPPLMRSFPDRPASDAKAAKPAYIRRVPSPPPPPQPESEEEGEVEEESQRAQLDLSDWSESELSPAVRMKQRRSRTPSYTPECASAAVI